VWDHPDLLVVAAAGNGGVDRGADGLVDPGSLYSPATAKNVLAVGASESLRIGQGYVGTYGDSPSGVNFPADPVHNDLISDEPWGLAAFSSRGPAADGRVRPDLVAPGTNIVSARSHHPSATYSHIRGDHYAFHSGSSQAAPLVSGAAALVREWYMSETGAAPSAALVRATLINGASDLAPGQYGQALTGTLVVSDDVESSGVWTATSGGWIVTNTYGFYSPDNAWVAQGTTGLGFWRLDATVDLSGVVSPTLLFWNHRSLSYSNARVHACGGEFVEYNSAQGPRVGWAEEGVDIWPCAGNSSTQIRFEFQCTSHPACSSDVWAIDDITVADGARLAEIGSAPDPGQGWGRLNLDRSLDHWGAMWFTDVVPGLQTGEVVTFSFPVPESGAGLCATLVWSDYPAIPNAAAALVNDLDLGLVGSQGAGLYPNGLDGPDRVNNVEQLLGTVGPGATQLTVRGENVPQGPQPFALVVTLDYQHYYLPVVLRFE
jgi:hypothetical protein